MAHLITQNAVDIINSSPAGQSTMTLSLQIIEVKEMSSADGARYRCALTDGKKTIMGMLSNDSRGDYLEKKFDVGHIIRIENSIYQKISTT